MSEILSITLSFFIFIIFLCAPLNTYKSEIFRFRSAHQNGIANLIINLNFLIIISLLPFKLISYLPFYFTALLLISTFNFLKRKEIFKFDKLIFSLFFVLFLIIRLNQDTPAL